MRKEDCLNYIESGNCPHAILLAGPPESDRAEFARRAAARFLLHTDDVSALKDCPFYIEAAGALPIDQLRDALKLLNAEAYERGRRCIVLLNAHELAIGSQNVLLKTLEEPPSDTLLLLVGVEAGFLPTILSRCMILRNETEPWETVFRRLRQDGVDAAIAEQCAKRSDGVYGRARKMAEPEALAFRAGAIGCVEQYRKGIRPIPEATALCTRTEAATDEETGETKKRARVSPELCQTFFDIFCELLCDALKLQVGWAMVDNTDCKPLVKNLSETFTTAQIQGMMNTLFEGRRMLSFRATPAQTLDWVLAKLP